MEYRTTITVEAPPELVWAVLSDVRHWPDWTPTVTAVTTDAAALTPGGVVTVSQPGRRPTAYTVSTLEPGLGAATRIVLAQAISPQDWNTLYLASPEFAR